MKIEDLKNTKIYLKTEDEVKQFQEKVFKLGVEWSDGSNSVCKSMFSDTFFTINEFLNLFMDCGNISFISKKRKQIFLEDVLAIEEPVVLVTGMPVLVRDRNDQEWEYDVLGRICSGECKYRCIGDTFYQCVPYKGNEHLLGTSGSFSY